MMLKIKSQDFLRLAELNIQSSSLPDDINRVGHKPISLSLVLISLAILLGFSLLLLSNKHLNIVSWLNLQKIGLLAHQSVASGGLPVGASRDKIGLPILESQIPDMNLAAVHQFLQNVPLKRAELLFKHEGEEQLNVDMVALDKVIIIPQIGVSNLKQVA